MNDFMVRIRVEIVPTGEADGVTGQAGGLSQVEEEALRKVSAAQALSIDDMEETLLENAYGVMRRALARHFSEVSKRGLSNGPGPTS